MKNPRAVWERYWSLHGDRIVPPWHVDPAWGVGDWHARINPYLHKGLPLVDVGCGNGYQTCRLPRWVSATSVLGVDVSPAAVTLARRQHRCHSTAHRLEVEFKVLDILYADAVDDFAAQIGPANIWIRFLLHLLETDARTQAIECLSRLTGGQGRIIDCEPIERSLVMANDSVSENQTMRVGFNAAIRHTRLPAGRLPALYRDAGMTILQSGRGSFVRADNGITGETIVVEWVVAGT